MLSLKVEEKGIELIFDIRPEVHSSLIGDPLRLNQVLTNLCNNAVKFVDAGGEILVSVAVESDADDEIMLHFSVRDDGIGIAPEEQSRLFHSFSQLDTSTTRKYGGTGLGLAICKNLVALMHGRIWVESEQGAGSTFHFTGRFGKQKVDESSSFFLTDELDMHHVLVVDDNGTSRDILTGMLAIFNLHVDQAASGKQALSILEQADGTDPYDLILMDWKMPEMDGIQTAYHIQHDMHLKHMPTVIMVTAYGREEAMQVAKDVTFSDFLTKPVTPSTLLDSIMRVAGRTVASESRTALRHQQAKAAIDKLKGSRVLLVEDHEINQELALELLTLNGLSVSVANNGQEALEILARESFDGVLMDCQMPVMDGYEATREIRKQERFKDLPVIAMTANAMAGDKEKVLQAGMNDHIAKPINVNEMFNIMARWIHPSRVETAKPAEKKSVQVPDMPSIDTASALEKMVYPHIYIKLLQNFRTGYSNFEADFRASRSADDPTAAHRCAHSLKGIAASIGAAQLEHAARMLQDGCEDGLPDTQIEDLLGCVLAALDPVLTDLQKLDQ